MTDERPRPRYGEYAPIEPAATAEHPPPRPEERLDAGRAPEPSAGPADAGTAPERSAGPPDARTARAVGAAPASPRPAPAAGTAPAVPRPGWDLPVTIALLVLGVYDVATSWRELADLAGVVGQVYALQGIGEYTAVDAAATIGLVANVARVTLLVLVVALSLARMRTGRRAFVVPLVGGVLGAVILVIAIAVAMLVDPAIAEWLPTSGSS